MKYISLSANHKQIKKILKKADELKVVCKDEVSWDDGFRYGDKANRNIKVFAYSEEFYTFLQELEPNVEITKIKGLTGRLNTPSAEEVVKLGY